MKTISIHFLIGIISLIILVVSCQKETQQPAPSGSAITALPTVIGIANATATADATGSTYSVVVPIGTNVKALSLTIPLATGLV